MTPMTSESISIGVPAGEPEFIRMPRQGSVCPWTGLSKAHLYNLAKEGKIRTFAVRARNATRGVRLVRLDSVLTFLAKCESEQEAHP